MTIAPSKDSRGALPSAVIKLGGAVGTTASQRAVVMAEVADVCAAFDGRVLIVHGGGDAASSRLDADGIEAAKIDGIRTTPPEAISALAEVFKGSCNAAWMLASQSAGLRPIGLTLSDGGSVRLEQKSDPRFGCVGDASAGDQSLVKALWSIGLTPIFCSFGLASSGWMNVNADDAAAALAVTVAATDAVFVSDVPCISDSDGLPIRQIDPSEAEGLITDGVVSGGMAAKLRAAIRASREGIARITITGQQDETSLMQSLQGTGLATTLGAAWSSVGEQS